MAYGLKYYSDVYWDHDSGNNDYRIGFYFDGYASTAIKLIQTESSFTHRIDGQKSSIDQIIMGSEISLEFTAAKYTRETYDEDFMESNFKDCIVKIIQDPTGTPVIKWVGILNPRNSDRTYQGYKINYSVSAVDIFAYLKKKYFTTNGNTNGSNYTGFEDMLSIIKIALSTVADISELQLDFRVQLGTYSDQMSSTENALKENEILQNLFHQEKDGDIDTDTCYEVIEKILTSFYCSIVQWDGYYWIFCNSEKDSYYFEYDWSTLTQQSRTANDRVIDLFGASTTMELWGKGSLSKTEGLQHIYTILKNRDSMLPLIGNTQFDTNITGWTNGDADNNSNQFNSITWDDLAGVGGTLEATWASGSPGTGSYNFHYGTSFVLDISDDPLVVVTYAVQVTSGTPTGGNPKVQVRLWNATDGYTTSNQGQHTLSVVGNMYTFEDTISTSGLTASSNYIDFELEVVDPATTQVTINVDYINVTQESSLTPNDWKMHFYQTSENQEGIKEYDIYISDQIESSDDIFSIKDSGGNYTNTWDRYGKTDTLSLIYLLNQQFLNDNSFSKNYVKCKIKDPNEDITPYSLLYDVTSRNTYYRIVRMERNYREATVDVEMVESFHGVTDITWFSNFNKLTTSYGS